METKPSKKIEKEGLVGWKCTLHPYAGTLLIGFKTRREERKGRKEGKEEGKGGGERRQGERLWTFAVKKKTTTTTNKKNNKTQ